MAVRKAQFARGPHIPTSRLLERLAAEAPDEVTLAWLLAQLEERSFGIVLLLLGLLGVLPAVSVGAGLLLVISAFQMILGHPAPVFPHRLAERPFATARLRRPLARLILVLRALERVIHPRWPIPFQATKRAVGGAVLLLGAGLFVPVPLSNIPVGLTVILVAFAYLEEDGVLLALAGMLVLALLTAALAALWGTVATAAWFIA
ncbi:exopolysaccharide biosynthesis protein [Roseomonas xinghualingensis]|uniref:exopolysaccharide biosynthesis protein n=1 Tax=Roseomonas xinghualingensis TaxID=2986475 RepID=UPI0021F24943|nr:exopolysaccharide biosynthesis protein [Roseomonas sp. SXEYE001]MCV4210009.1 exopolysaccharide biosynthesis protein [Roseomonas sp. SXEYE001]